MKLPRRLTFLRGPLDAAPAVNVVLLLLIFFLLGSSFVLQSGIKVDLPRSPFSMPFPEQAPIVTVLMEPEHRDPATGQSQPRQPIIFFNNEIVKMGDLQGRLERAGRGGGHSLMLKADRDVSNGTLVEIMNLAMAQKWSVILATERGDPGR